jgi:hypothetical protein
VGLCLLNGCYFMKNCGGWWWSITTSYVSGWKRRVVCVHPWRNNQFYPLNKSHLAPESLFGVMAKQKFCPCRERNPAPSAQPLCLLSPSLSITSSYSLSHSDYLCVRFYVYSVFFHSILFFFGFPLFIYLFLSPCSSVQHPGTWESVCLVHMSVPTGSWK